MLSVRIPREALILKSCGTGTLAGALFLIVQRNETDYSFLAGFSGSAGGVFALDAIAAMDFSAALVLSGSLSACASNWLTCHICVGESICPNPGMPVMRRPLETFQYVSPTGSSVTMSSPLRSCGGR